MTENTDTQQLEHRQCKDCGESFDLEPSEVEAVLAFTDCTCRVAARTAETCGASRA